MIIAAVFTLVVLAAIVLWAEAEKSRLLRANPRGADLYEFPVDPSEYFKGNADAILAYRAKNREIMNLPPLTEHEKNRTRKLCGESGTAILKVEKV